jgi:GNAT superfamily N-acetyltransferase
LEEAAMNAWPALETYLLDGWVLRFANGYTKRANSVNPTYPSESDDLDAKIAACEAIYGHRGLPTIFRLTSFGAPPSLDETLAGRGYRVLDPTLVMARDCSEPGAPPLRTHALEEWLAIYSRFAGVALDAHGNHAAMLAKIPGTPSFATLESDGRPVAAGLLVPDAECAGLFDIVCDPALLRQGNGRRLTQGLLTLAARSGAVSAYLQVTETNLPARHLYESLGFAPRYRYWYRIAPP